MTKITKLPASIATMPYLTEVYVKETPLKQPKLAVAMRGIAAIKEFFSQNEEDLDEVGDAGDGAASRNAN